MDVASRPVSLGQESTVRTKGTNSPKGPAAVGHRTRLSLSLSHQTAVITSLHHRYLREVSRKPVHSTGPRARAVVATVDVSERCLAMESRRGA